jgi:hypothetical protein
MAHTMILLIVLTGCATPGNRITPSAAPYRVYGDSFEQLDEEARHWRVDLSNSARIMARLEHEDRNGFISLRAIDGDSSQEHAIHRSMDLVALRGQRLRLAARVRVQSASDASARIRLSTTSSGNDETYSDFTDSPSLASASWKKAYVVVDVSQTVTSGDIALTLKGQGTASFDDISITTLGPSPPPPALALSTATIERLTTLVRAMTLVRYFHPSDQSATVDWDAFSIRAIRTVLNAPPSREMRDILASVFERVAPLARFDKAPDRTAAVPHGPEAIRSAMPRDRGATHLVRWHHVGLGTDEPSIIYHSFRDGIDPDDATAYVYAIPSIPHLATCGRAEIRAALHATTGSAWIFGIMYHSGRRESYIKQALSLQHDTVAIARGDVPADIQQIKIGIYLAGRATVQLTGLSIRCENGESVDVDVRSSWQLSRDTDLFSKTISDCGGRMCLSVERLPADREARYDRDVMEVDVGSKVRMVLPVAVWTDGKVTFPRIPDPDLPAPDYTLNDLPVRLAAVAATWGTLSRFYPYFADQPIDWPAALPVALADAAAARSPGETHQALSRMVAKLQDGHAHVRHPTHSVQGMVPVALRKFGERVFVVGGLQDYISAIPVGSELVSVDGVVAKQLYATNHALVSAATENFRDYLASLYISVGPIGRFKHVRTRSPNGAEVESLLPLVSRQVFDKDIHVFHPRSGSEIAPAVFYIDPMSLTPATIPTLIPSLQIAKVVILDMRGYVQDGIYDLLAHFVSRSISSPHLQAFSVAIQPTGISQDLQWEVWPAAPLLTCRLIVLTDARAISAAETVLQILRDGHLATIIGEPSAGTNGDVNTFSVPGGFTVRFTGLRVSAADGSTIQGHGIVPDQIVHPTIEGIRAGRDELLEAALSLARQSAAK